MPIEKIVENAKDLLATATLLANEKKIVHSAHFSILCLEECTKAIMCVPEVSALFEENKRFCHHTKNQLIGVFHFIAGGFSSVYQLKRAKDENFLGGTNEDFQRVLDDMLDFIGMSGIESLARVVNKYLKETISKVGKDAFKGYNEIRKNSVYSDVVDGVVQMPNQRVSEENATELLEDAKFAIAIISMILNNKIDWKEFEDTYPSRFDNLEDRVQEMITYVRSHDYDRVEFKKGIS